MNKIFCPECGSNLIETGILVEGGTIAIYNEKENSFYYDEIDDIEIKCPECYNMCNIPGVKKESNKKLL